MTKNFDWDNPMDKNRYLDDLFDKRKGWNDPIGNRIDRLGNKLDPLVKKPLLEEDPLFEKRRHEAFVHRNMMERDMLVDNQLRLEREQRFQDALDTKLESKRLFNNHFDMMQKIKIGP